MLLKLTSLVPWVRVLGLYSILFVLVPLKSSDLRVHARAVSSSEPGLMAGNIQIHGHPFLAVPEPETDPSVHSWFAAHTSTAIRVNAVDIDVDVEMENVKRATQHEQVHQGGGGRVPTCTRKHRMLYTLRKWTISYDRDDRINGVNCGQSVRYQLKTHWTCLPLSDWTCVASGTPGYGGVTIQFYTPRTCSDEMVKESVWKGTRGRVELSCQHL